MIVKLALIAIATLVRSATSSYSYTSSISTCITYENNALYKWGRYSTTTSSGYAGDASDTTSVCGGSSNYRCSSDSSSYLPQNSKKLLGPTNYSNGYSQESYLYSSSSSSTLYSNYFGTSTYCWYKFTPYYTYINNVNIKINSLLNANAEVYYESSTNVFSYKGSLASGNSMDVSVSNYYPVWVLVTPSSSSAYVSVTATSSGSSYSYSTDDSYLVAILVPTIVGGTFIILIVIFIVVGNIIRRKRIQEALNNAEAARANSAQPAPAPQLYYPPGHVNYNPNPAFASVMYAPAQPSYQPAPGQQIYVLEPVPMEPTLQPIYAPAQPIQTNQNIYTGSPVYPKYQ